MPHDPRDLLASAGYIEKPSFVGHSKKILDALDSTPCEHCGRPVGREARGSSVCVDCISLELVNEGVPVDEVAEAIWGLRSNG